MQIAAHKIDNHLNNSITSQKSALLYGADQGLVQERKKIIIQKVLGKDFDQMQITKLDAKNIKNSDVIVDQLNSIDLMMHKKIILVENADNNSSKHIEIAITNNKSDNFLLTLAKELTPASKLRKLYEKQADIISIPCYVDDANAIRMLIIKMFTEHNYQYDPEIPDYLAQQFSGNRLIIKNEIEKLLIYCHKNKHISMEDIANISTSLRESNFQEIANNIANLNLNASIKSISNHLNQKIPAVTIIRVITNYFQRLRYIKNLIDQNQYFDEICKSLRPPLFFKQKSLTQNHLQYWPYKHLNIFLEKLEKIEIIFKSSNHLPDTQILLDTISKIIYAQQKRNNL
jgi:DNA polymerase III subunit delta